MSLYTAVDGAGAFEQRGSGRSLDFVGLVPLGCEAKVRTFRLLGVETVWRGEGLGVAPTGFYEGG